ncbi:MAG TPA: zf-HC2 domain-containing protein [Terriglobales bacterium]|nr:zf-HC2 domain-containing protein [Terriglobales bacterium]
MEKNSQFDRTEDALGLTCLEFDALLTDALDGVLSAASQRRFEKHRHQCPTCGPLFGEAAAGMNWLNSLEEIEAPANLMHNILAATTMQSTATAAKSAKLSWKQRTSEVLADVLTPFRALVAQPRMAMTGAMAVFSLSLTLNLAGVKLSDLRHIDLRPSAIKEQATMRYYETTSRVVKYYENIRLVYEVESRLQELKRATTSEEPQQRPPERKKDETRKQDNKERRQNYYSMERRNVQLAKWSTTELNQGSILKPNLSPEQPGAERSINNTEAFATIELPRGLQTVDTQPAASALCGLAKQESGRSLIA